MKLLAKMALGVLINTGLAPNAKGDNYGALQALESVDAGCLGEVMRPCGGGWVAVCQTKEAKRFYFIRTSRGKGHVFKLLEHNGRGDFDVGPLALNLEYEENGRQISMGWYLGDKRPSVPDKSIEGEAVCAPERYREHYNRIAVSMHRPSLRISFVGHEIRFERHFVECDNGTNFIVTRGGLLIPLLKTTGLEVAPPTGSASLRVRDVLAARKGEKPAGIAFTIAAQSNPATKGTRLLLRAQDRTVDPVAAGDARVGDHFEIWLPPPVLQPTCDEAMKIPNACTAPASPPPTVRIWIGLAADGKPVVTAEPAEAAKAIAVISGQGALAVDLGASLLAASGGDLAVLYRDRTSGTLVGTADPDKGDFSTIGEVTGLDPPPMEEHIVPLK